MIIMKEFFKIGSSLIAVNLVITFLICIMLWRLPPFEYLLITVRLIAGEIFIAGVLCLVYNWYKRSRKGG